jgi:hypothetical protein
VRKPPPEPRVCKDVALLAPGFWRKLQLALAKLKIRGWHPVITETVRTPERQAWLYGFGREWDDGRGVVTNAPTNTKSWHGFGLAVDITSGDHDWDEIPERFWKDLQACVEAEGLVSGAGWSSPDKPHVQFGPGMRVSPSPLAAHLQEDGGNQLVWEYLHAA